MSKAWILTVQRKVIAGHWTLVRNSWGSPVGRVMSTQDGWENHLSYEHDWECWVGFSQCGCVWKLWNYSITYCLSLKRIVSRTANRWLCWKPSKPQCTTFSSDPRSAYAHALAHMGTKEPEIQWDSYLNSSIIIWTEYNWNTFTNH